MNKKGFLYKSIVLFLFLIIGTSTKVSANEKTVHAYFTIEKFVLGQGYALEPYKVEIEDGELVSDVLMRLSEQEGIKLDYIYSTYGWYLRGIKGIDNGKNDIPNRILKNYGNALQDYLIEGDMVNNSKNASDLEEFSYSEYSGWVYFVNDEWQFVGMGSTKLHDNDVVRLKYTIVEGDSGFSMSGSEGMSFAKQTEAIRILADIKEREKANSNPMLKQIYQDSIEILSDYDASAMEVDGLTGHLIAVSQALEEGNVTSLSSESNEIVSLKNNVLANNTIQRIQMIPEQIKIDTGYLVRRAMKLYNSLPVGAKNQISEQYYEQLTTADNQLKNIEKEEQQKKEKQEKADAISTRINNIGTVTLSKEATIQSIRKDYDMLDVEIKQLISTNTYSNLVAAERTLLELKKKDEHDKAMQQKANIVINQINAIGTVTLSKESTIQNARKAYDLLDTDAKKLISKTVFNKLTTAEAALANLKNAELVRINTPATTVIKSVKKVGKGKVKVTWKKITNASGYEIYMSLKKSTGYKKISTIKTMKTVTCTKAKLKMKKIYYFKVRTFRTVNGKTYYGKYSAVKKVKIK